MRRVLPRALRSGRYHNRPVLQLPPAASQTRHGKGPAVKGQGVSAHNKNDVALYCYMRAFWCSQVRHATPRPHAPAPFRARESAGTVPLGRRQLMVAVSPPFAGRRGNYDRYWQGTSDTLTNSVAVIGTVRYKIRLHFYVICCQGTEILHCTPTE